MTSALLSDTLAAPRTHAHMYANKEITNAHFACMHAHVQINADTETPNPTDKQTDTDILPQTELRSYWTNIIV